ncbi:MAG: hypothetical protein QG566_594 [Patescibacteria group bacterium]|nr:hypothetical protein [Patescibacteria group bacterium]
MMEPEIKKHIDKKLVRRMTMFAIILTIMTGVLVYEIFISNINFLWIIVGIAVGIFIGFVAGRIFTIEWSQEKKVVVGRLDLIGGIVLTLYILVSVGRSWIFAHWFKGMMLTAFTFSFIEGAMIGRLLSMRFNIKRVLIEQDKI